MAIERTLARVAQLGSIFDDDAADDGPRGRDLRTEVTIPAWSMGHPDGYAVAVPIELPIDDETAHRTPSPHDDGEHITLRLPESFPDGGTLRLRGQGERGPTGRVGDLLVTVRIDETDAIARVLPSSLAQSSSPNKTVIIGVTVALAALAAAVYAAL